MIAKPNERLSVLIVDDETDIREALSSFLDMMELFNFVVEAADGQEGMVKVQNQSFDLIITDLLMPKTSGIDFIKQAKAHITATGVKPKNIPAFIVLSGNLTGDEIKKAQSLGVKYALTKPCTAEDFIRKVAEVMKAEKPHKIATSS